MKDESIESKFSKDLDAYFRGVVELNKQESDEYKELFELGKNLADNDFSINSHKDAVYQKIWLSIHKNKRSVEMNKFNMKHKSVKVAAFAMVCLLGISIFSTSSAAQDFMDKIIRTISLGHITVIQTESPEVNELPMPSELVGKIYDKEGNPIDVISKDSTEKLYDAEGEEIVTMVDGEIITTSKEGTSQQIDKLVIEDSQKLNKYTSFNVMLPTYLPEGYIFDRAEFYKDENGEVSDKYIDLIFSNGQTGQYFFMQQRLANEETAYEFGTDGEIKEIDINGVKAIITDGRKINWETNDVLYGLSGGGVITEDELIKIAESIK
ncbi:DUF4367 domain-containing protein [Vallitalea okinawensis]|uniref:DUF4367 domain-containing protein n=1 Tax=Vallitalea okinawensis TaxID=2078660 RepID=UPI000CFC0BCF|nr:DUF4367 domain-containing protein [Vallitalea okinawensis]